MTTYFELGDLELGEIYKGRIRILGSGSFGEVGLVKFRRREAALKTCLNGEDSGILREAEILRHLNGAGGAPILLAVFTGNEKAFLATFIPGDTLYRALHDTVYPAYYYLEICLQICRKVDEIHGLRYVHNDLHFGNIMIRVPHNLKVPEVSIIDYGLACPVGTPAPVKLHHLFWRAPEICIGAPCTPSSDVFALSHILQQTLKYRGKVLFADTESHILKIHELLGMGMRLVARNRPQISQFVAALENAIDIEKRLAGVLSTSGFISSSKRIREVLRKYWRKFKKLFRQ